MDPTQVIVVALLLVFIAAMMIGARQKLKRLSAAAPPPAIDVRQVRDIRGVVDRLLVEMEEISREMNARLDTKMAALEELIRQADQRLARLESLPSGPPTGAAAAEPKPAASPEPAPPPEPPSRYDSIYDLADQGLSASEISHRTGKPAGEVELILNLRANPRPTNTQA